jgi:hypothetical protein
MIRHNSLHAALNRSRQGWLILYLVRPMRSLVLTGSAIALAICGARGDEPLPPPSRIIATSPNGAIRAVCDPNAGTTIEDVERRAVLWRLPGWYRSVFVANDGKHFVTGYDGLNLLPRDFNDDLVLLTFWREGRKIREIRVRDLVPDHSILERTASHYYWGRIESIDAQGRLKVNRADGKTFFFDVTTGNETKA